MKTYHFISGLPRSGSTLLTAILNQNPKFYSNISNPLARFVKRIIIESHSGPGYYLQCPETKQQKLIQQLVDTYHYDIAAEVCFNTNRGWTSLLPVLEKTYPTSRVICCVRDIPEILNSFEKLFKSNPFVISKLYTEETAETVYTRSTSLMIPGGMVRDAYDSLKEAITGPQKYMLMIIEYKHLTNKPEETMRALYNFIGEPYYQHDFNNLESNWEAYDHEVGIPGLHRIRRKLENKSTEIVLPPDIWQQFSDLEVWR